MQRGSKYMDLNICNAGCTFNGNQNTPYVHGKFVKVVFRI